MYKVTINGEILHEPDTGSSYRLSAGRIDEEINQIPGFTFSIPVSNPQFGAELNDRRDIIEVTNTITGELEFEGTLLTHDVSMTDTGRLSMSGVCEGYLGYLCSSVQPYHHYESSTAEEFLTALLNVHNEGRPEAERIYLGACDFSGDNTNSKTTAYRSTLEEIKVNLLDRIGGELRVRRTEGRLVLDYMHRLGSRSSTRIALADNMKSLTAETDSTNIVTRLIPLGCQLAPDETAERLTIAGVNDGKIYIDDEKAAAKYGIIVGTAVFDDITLPENLIKAGREYLGNNNRIRRAYRAQVLDLSLINSGYESVRCGNSYTFVNEFMGLDEELRVVKRSVDIYRPYSPSVEIGDKSERMTDIAVRTAQLIEYELPKQKLDILASAKATATDLINAGINGYVVVNKNELLIMDTPEKETATRVWRWNSGGFGYSDTGYNGEYGLAMTMDGAIVADFITAGVLRGLEIVNGDGTFHVSADGKVTASSMEINNGSGAFHVSRDGSVSASAINISGGSINISTSSETTDIIQLRSGAWSGRFSPYEARFQNSDNNYSTMVQSSGIWLSSGGNYSIILSTMTGGITCNNLYFQDDSGNQRSARSVLTGLNNQLDSLSSRIAALEASDKASDKTLYVDDLWLKLSDGTINSLRDQLSLIDSYIQDLYRRTGGGA